MHTTDMLKGRIADAVATARDKALVSMGKEAALRQRRRGTSLVRSPTGRWMAAVLAVGAMLTAGVVVHKVRKRKAVRTAAAPQPAGPVEMAGPTAVADDGLVADHGEDDELEAAMTAPRPARRHAGLFATMEVDDAGLHADEGKGDRSRRSHAG